jgi:hypothetical protein
VLRRIFGPKRDEVTGDWRKLNNEELHNSHTPPSIIRMTTSSRMRWAGNLARIGRKRILKDFAGKAGRKETIWKI